MSCSSFFIEFPTTCFALNSSVSLLFKLSKLLHLFRRIHWFLPSWSTCFFLLLASSRDPTKTLLRGSLLLLVNIHCHPELHGLHLPLCSTGHSLLSFHRRLSFFFSCSLSHQILLFWSHHPMCLGIELFSLLTEYFLTNFDMFSVSNIVKRTTTARTLIQIIWY